MSKLGAIGHRLYTGEVSYDFIGRRRRWYTISAILIVVSIIQLAWRGPDFGRAVQGRADVKAATQAGVMVVNAPQSNIVSAAELAVGLLLAAARHIPAATTALRGGEWKRSRYTGVTSIFCGHKGCCRASCRMTC